MDALKEHKFENSIHIIKNFPLQFIQHFLLFCSKINIINKQSTKSQNRIVSLSLCLRLKLYNIFLPKNSLAEPPLGNKK